MFRQRLPQAGPGNRRELWPGSTVGDWARWPLPGRDVSGLRQPPGPERWWTKGCIWPRVGLRTRAAVPRRVCRRSGGATARTRSWRLEMPGAGRGNGSSQGQVGCRRRTAFGMSPSFREGLAAQGMWYVLDVPGGATVWPGAFVDQSGISGGSGAPANPSCGMGSAGPWSNRSDELPEEAWREITVAEGSQGPRTYRFSAQRVRATKRRKPGEVVWAIWRCNLDGSEPRYYLSNRPRRHSPGDPGVVGGSRWRIETEFELRRVTWGWTNTRPGALRVASPHSHVPAGRQRSC